MRQKCYKYMRNYQESYLLCMCWSSPKDTKELHWKIKRVSCLWACVKAFLWKLLSCHRNRLVVSIWHKYGFISHAVTYGSQVNLSAGLGDSQACNEESSFFKQEPTEQYVPMITTFHVTKATWGSCCNNQTIWVTAEAHRTKLSTLSSQNITYFWAGFLVMLKQLMWLVKKPPSYLHEKGYCSDNSTSVIGMVKLPLIGIFHSGIDDNPPTSEELQQYSASTDLLMTCETLIRFYNNSLINVPPGHFQAESTATLCVLVITNRGSVLQISE